MATSNKEHSSNEPVMYVVPVDDYNYSFQQLSMLQQMGYPVEERTLGTDISSSDRFLAQNSTHHGNWAEFVIDPNFENWIDDTSYYYPKFPNKSEVLDDVTLNLLRKHPIELVHMIEFGSLWRLRKVHYAHTSRNDRASFMRLFHQRSDYPWQHVIERCIVAAKIRKDNKRKISPDNPHTFPKSEIFAQQLIDEGIPPINSEQIAGIISDFYQLVERIFPEFVAFRRGFRRR